MMRVLVLLCAVLTSQVYVAFGQEFNSYCNVSTAMKLKIANLHLDDLPLCAMATSFTQELVKKQYQYLTLIHHHYQADRFYPNVAKYFRKCMEKTSGMLDRVATYIMAKQINHTRPPTLRSAFRQAFKSERNTVETLTTIHQAAEVLGDAEVAELVGADLIPEVTKLMNELHTHFSMLHSVTRHNLHGLGEFIYDKNL
uniref:uncharacterized protein LOC100185827 isoform X2 n=1 Tax=Ciona intestinalis TaxID=7719 RepID=UPI000180D247|nr:uncharacterized protein LOC100185827 isoform X2 [Ciona intestinalis]|eukprot:XP_026690849.1 uncharacterized protein LOC100185827 isoform X2 [Ciona intestinalis]